MLAKLDNDKIVNIEMQVINKGDMVPRSIFYASKIMSEQLAKGLSYNTLKKVIMINILDYSF
ncbi:MAG: PD-(D/E)XK nuclease family transposase [Clostridia bacterium]